MNKRISAVLCLALLLCLPQTAAATETGCRITGEAVVTLPGRTVEIPIEISGNPGFTNFGIELAYDRETLRLEEILVPVRRETVSWTPFPASTLPGLPGTEIPRLRKPMAMLPRLPGSRSRETANCLWHALRCWKMRKAPPR